MVSDEHRTGRGGGNGERWSVPGNDDVVRIARCDRRAIRRDGDGIERRPRRRDHGGEILACPRGPGGYVERARGDRRRGLAGDRRVKAYDGVAETFWRILQPIAERLADDANERRPATNLHDVADARVHAIDVQ